MKRGRAGWMMIACAALLVLASSTGCVGRGWVSGAGVSRSAAIDVDYPASEETTEVTLRFGAAELRADARAEHLLEGVIEYNHEQMTPEITSGSSWVQIRQRADRLAVAGFKDIRNEWDLHFGTAQPIRLLIEAGAYDGHWDLGGMPLRELAVNQGASRTTFDFSRPNPEVMDRLEFRTGAADLELLNLANAGFREMEFEGGASSYMLDFGGQLMRDGTVDVRAGVASIRIGIPSDTPARVQVRGFTSVDAERGYVRQGDAYTTPAWVGAAGPRLEIEVDAGLANVDLELSRPATRV